jgi:hypothetical protein
LSFTAKNSSAAELPQLFHTQFAASAAEGIRMPAEEAGGFGKIAAAFADYSSKE